MEMEVPRDNMTSLDGLLVICQIQIQPGRPSKWLAAAGMLLYKSTWNGMNYYARAELPRLYKIASATKFSP
jgi:hypothetical protein